MAALHRFGSANLIIAFIGDLADILERASTRASPLVSFVHVNNNLDEETSFKLVSRPADVLLDRSSPVQRIQRSTHRFCHMMDHLITRSLESYTEH